MMIFVWKNLLTDLGVETRNLSNHIAALIYNKPIKAELEQNQNRAPEITTPTNEQEENILNFKYSSRLSTIQKTCQDTYELLY